MNPFGLGRLPGDLRLRAGRVTIPFPFTSTLVVSTALTLLYAAATLR